MKIVLFGSLGCFGTEFSNACVLRDHELVEPTRQEIDLTDAASVQKFLEVSRPDVVVNAAALVNMTLCEEEPQTAFAIHASAVLGLANTCADQDAVLVQTSTHAVFDGTKVGAYSEQDLPNPRNVYAVSKYAGEQFAQNISPKHYVARFPTMFGQRRNEAFGFVDKVIQWLDGGDDLRIADDKIDSPTYARDAADRILDMIEQGAPFGLYHLFNEGRVSYYEFVVSLRDLLGKQNVIHRCKDADFSGKGLKSLNTALTTINGKPMRPWRDALSAYLDCRNV